MHPPLVELVSVLSFTIVLNNWVYFIMPRISSLCPGINLSFRSSSTSSQIWASETFATFKEKQPCISHFYSQIADWCVKGGVEHLKDKEDFSWAIQQGLWAQPLPAPATASDQFLFLFLFLKWWVFYSYKDLCFTNSPLVRFFRLLFSSGLPLRKLSIRKVNIWSFLNPTPLLLKRALFFIG